MTTFPLKRNCSLAVILFLIAPQYATAYQNYSADGETGNCAACHGDFNSGTYSSNFDGILWEDDLMGGHRDFISSCDICHSGQNRSPVPLNVSDEATQPYGCVGCHGREEDITANDGAFGGATAGRGDGLRARHMGSESYTGWPGGIPGGLTCANCHSADTTPVGEHVLPFNYDVAGTIRNPCTAEAAFGTSGLDNDGDGPRDGDDSDCVATVPTPGDINSDGKADVVWRNSSSGQNWAYLMNGASIDSSISINTVSDQAWQIVGNGDYDGDGDADVLWRNSSTGQNWMYLMQDGAIDSSVSVNTVADQAWQIVGNGDYDGDGDADVLWRNSSTGQNWMYLMTGASIDSSVAVNTIQTTWQVVGNGDYNGDDKADILWRNSGTGQVWMYLMNGATIDSSLSVTTVASQAWQVVGNGDFDGDGDADILWRNSSNGQNWMYLMNGATISSSESVNTVAGAQWQVKGDGDYNGDGNADILWRNVSIGQNWMYLMSGSTIDSSVSVNTVADTSWQIINVN